MPLYEYRCKKCRHEFERVQKFSDPPIKKCPECGKPSVEKKISKTAFQLKGDGWFKDGYSKGKPAPKDTVKKDNPCAGCKHCPSAKKDS